MLRESSLIEAWLKKKPILELLEEYQEKKKKHLV